MRRFGPGGFGYRAFYLGRGTTRRVNDPPRGPRTRQRVWLGRGSTPHHAGGTARRLFGDGTRMSDLLGRMINRAKGAAPAVEPILASRFEVPALVDVPPEVPERSETRH